MSVCLLLPGGFVGLGGWLLLRSAARRVLGQIPGLHSVVLTLGRDHLNYCKVSSSANNNNCFSKESLQKNSQRYFKNNLKNITS